MSNLVNFTNKIFILNGGVEKNDVIGIEKNSINSKESFDGNQYINMNFIKPGMEKNNELLRTSTQSSKPIEFEQYVKPIELNDKLLGTSIQSSKQIEDNITEIDDDTVILTDFNDEILNINSKNEVKLYENEYIVDNLPVEYEEYNEEYFEEINYNEPVEIDQSINLQENIFNKTDIIKLNKIDELIKNKIININTIKEGNNINNLGYSILNDEIYTIPNINYSEMIMDDLEYDF
jgi:hypothetical protein